MDYCLSQFKRQSGIDLVEVNDQRAIQRLRSQCEAAKRTLSTQTSATIDCEALHQGIDFSTTLSRAKFEALNADLFKKCMTPVTQVLKDAGVSKAEIDQV
jgi:molecular chaperone DnaK (HSP70)